MVQSMLNVRPDLLTAEEKHCLKGDSRRLTDFLRLLMLTDSPGLAECAGTQDIGVAVHVGAPVLIRCRRRGESHCGTAVHGDIEIIPARTVSRWEYRDRSVMFMLGLAPKALHSAAEELDLDPARVEIRNHFQLRDAQLEHILWAAKAEMERGFPCGRLYLEGLATALAAQLVANYSMHLRRQERFKGGFPDRKVKQVIAFIEENLGSDLSLPGIATAAGLSLSHCKALFRQSVGLPIHQYVIRRRVERAVGLMREGKLSISQIALESGFAHQSHLAMHMRRMLGVSPKTLQATLA
jgi:AraC family transcriptional regulator